MQHETMREADRLAARVSGMTRKCALLGARRREAQGEQRSETNAPFRQGKGKWGVSVWCMDAAWQLGNTTSE